MLIVVTSSQRRGAEIEGTELSEKTLEPIVATLARAWLRNNYPDRGLDWSTYPDFIGHDGCFRCHDDAHKDAKGVVIDSRCSICHVVLSERESDPAILETLGIKPR